MIEDSFGIKLQRIKEGNTITAIDTLEKGKTYTVEGIAQSGGDDFAAVSRQFTFGMTIDPRLHFYVPFQELALNSLKGMIVSNRFALVQAPFRFGKTSHLIALAKWLTARGMPPLIISCVQDVLWTNQEFQELRETLQENGQRPALLIDEFQLIAHSDPQKRNITLTQLKQLRDLQLVSACLGFGTYSLMHLLDSSNHLIMSPFPKEPGSVVYLSGLSPQGISAMFMDWSHDRGRTISAAAIQAIIEDTGGYPGLVGYAGMMLENTSYSTIDLEQWGSIKTSIIQSYSTTPQIRRLFDLFEQPQLAPVLSKLCATLFITPSQTELESTLVLADFGLLRGIKQEVGTPTFVLSCPLFHYLLLNHFYLGIRTLAFGDVLITPETQEHLMSHLPDLATLIIQHIDYGKLWQVEILNVGGGGVGTPSEHQLQAECFAVLASYFRYFKPSQWFVSIETKIGDHKQRRADILLRNGKRVLIELKSGLTSLKEMNEAVVQAQDYARAFQVKHILVINFTKYSSQDAIARWGEHHRHELTSDGSELSVCTVKLYDNSPKFKWIP
eukprot:TRINITY_DN677_c0_g5_i1.p1 TRINITY_DN677_c0_g5~~TRINITY_DN677_c0_g5_i1.p1  ORF type:complete len:614 (-),score=73.92 TRINITY_DN677_c0_g5_i1:182-1849(-)